MNRFFDFKKQIPPTVLLPPKCILYSQQCTCCKAEQNIWPMYDSATGSPLVQFYSWVILVGDGPMPQGHPLPTEKDGVSDWGGGWKAIGCDVTDCQSDGELISKVQLAAALLTTN